MRKNKWLPLWVLLTGLLFFAALGQADAAENGNLAVPDQAVLVQDPAVQDTAEDGPEEVVGISGTRPMEAAPGEVAGISPGSTDGSDGSLSSGTISQEQSSEASPEKIAGIDQSSGVNSDQNNTGSNQTTINDSQNTGSQTTAGNSQNNSSSNTGSNSTTNDSAKLDTNTGLNIGTDQNNNSSSNNPISDDNNVQDNAGNVTGNTGPAPENKDAGQQNSGQNSIRIQNLLRSQSTTNGGGTDPTSIPTTNANQSSGTNSTGSGQTQNPVVPENQSQPEAPVPTPASQEGTPPSAPTPNPLPQNLRTGQLTYAVQPGDTLYLIGKKFNVSVEDIKKANGLVSDNLEVGQKLIIPSNTSGTSPPDTAVRGSEKYVVTYTVKPGDTLYLIGKRYGVTVAEIKAANNLSSDYLYVGQKLYIPTNRSNTGYNTSGTAGFTYTVQPGDSLYLIGKRFGVTPQQIKAANGLSSDYIVVGQKLYIPGKTGSSSSQTVRYTVQPGDSLYLIAKKFWVSVESIKAANGLKSNEIYPGQVLVIPSSANNSVPEVSRSMSISREDFYLLARLVYAEARGEPYEGMVAVAAVVLNRLRHPDFPKTIAGVIYQPGAFTAVSDGQINLTPNDIAFKAVQDALNGWDPSEGALYYWNPATATSKWVWTRQIIKQIGNHVFAR